ncbi:hypothetical protein TWF696_001120 [Orbilia brochopaga]|uniref:Uncharacterized protein n=1 Tax=Orbilia brochopaga TaxID=3140254 RepID=A0AAV9VG40_9PEZI
MKASRRRGGAVWPMTPTSWLLVPLLTSFLLYTPTVHGFWQDSLVRREEDVDRRETISNTQGRAEDKRPYYCKQAGVPYNRSPVDAVVVWNRPDSFVTLAFALYFGRDCTATRSRTQKALPQVVMVMDKRRLRGLHVANLVELGISPECKSWQAVKVQEELLPGGSLAGLTPEELPGSVVYWDGNGERQVALNAIKFINAIEYERLDRRRSIGHFLRAVLEMEIGSGGPNAPVPEDLQAAVENLNEQLGVPSGAEIWNPPVDSLPGGAEDLQLGVDDGYVPRAPPLRPELENRLAQALNVGAIDGSMTLQEIVDQPVPMDELLESFDDVPDLPAAKELWYRRIEARMMFNLRVLTNSWRILWAWQQAREEVLAEQQAAGITAEENQQDEGNILEEEEEGEVEVEEVQVQDEDIDTRPAQPEAVQPRPSQRAGWRLIENANEAAQDDTAVVDEQQDESYRVEIEEEPFEGNPMVVGKPATGNQIIEEATPENAPVSEVQPDEEISVNLGTRIRDFDNVAAQFDDDFRTFDPGLMMDFGRRLEDHEQLLRQQGLELDALMGTNLMEAFEPPAGENAGTGTPAGFDMYNLEEDSDDDGLLSLRLRKKQKPNEQL